MSSLKCVPLTLSSSLSASITKQKQPQQQLREQQIAKRSVRES